LRCAPLSSRLISRAARAPAFRSIPASSRALTVGTTPTDFQGRPRRSVLYMPGSNAKAVAKARTIPADSICIDLEDAVAPAAKKEARMQVLAAIQEGGFGAREIAVRANGLDTPWGADDIAMIAQSGAHAVCLPKVDSMETVIAVHQVMAKAGAPASMALWCMIETPLGVLRAEEICRAGRDSRNGRLTALVMGTSDLTKELRAQHTPDRHAMHTSLQMVLLAARAHGVLALDGVHLNFKDAAEFAAHCRQAKEMGYDGKTLIHPTQVAVANEIFAPTPDQVAESEEIIAAHTAAVAEGENVVVVRGKLVENLHVEEALRVLSMHAAIKELAAGSA